TIIYRVSYQSEAARQFSINEVVATAPTGTRALREKWPVEGAMIRLTLRHAVSFSSCGCEKRPRRTWKLPRRRGFPIEPIVLTGVTAQLLGVNSSGCAIVTHRGLIFLCGDIAMHHIDRAQFVRTDASFHYGFDACGTIEVPASLLLDQRYRQRP